MTGIMRVFIEMETATQCRIPNPGSLNPMPASSIPLNQTHQCDREGPRKRGEQRRPNDDSEDSGRIVEPAQRSHTARTRNVPPVHGAFARDRSVDQHQVFSTVGCRSQAQRHHRLGMLAPSGCPASMLAAHQRESAPRRRTCDPGCEDLRPQAPRLAVAEQQIRPTQQARHTQASHLTRNFPAEDHPGSAQRAIAHQHSNSTEGVVDEFMPIENCDGGSGEARAVRGPLFPVLGQRRSRQPAVPEKQGRATESRFC